LNPNTGLCPFPPVDSSRLVDPQLIGSLLRLSRTVKSSATSLLRTCQVDFYSGQSPMDLHRFRGFIM
ncbi:19545_t:CDS:2, partial [Racocetra fulgida]